MHGYSENSGQEEPIHVPVGMGEHEMDVQRFIRSLIYGLCKVRAEGEVGYEVPVHHIHVYKVPGLRAL